MILATTQVEDFDRFLEIFSTKGAEKRGSTVRRARRSFGIPTRPTGSGCCSTGTRRAGRASPRTRRSRRSCRRPVTKGGRRLRRSAAATTRSPSSEVLDETKEAPKGASGLFPMELGGLEPPTSWVRSRRSPS